MRIRPSFRLMDVPGMRTAIHSSAVRMDIIERNATSSEEQVTPEEQLSAEQEQQLGVFERLVEYPCEFEMKVIGVRQGDFHLDMVEAVGRVTETSVDTIRYTTRDKGKYRSVTIFAPVRDARQLLDCYAAFDRDPRVRFKF